MQAIKSIKNTVVATILLIIVATASWSLIPEELFFVHDYVHGARVAEMLRGWQDGQLPVRWSQNFGYGYGMPLFQFYSPLPYAVGALFYWLNNDLSWSVRVLMLLPNIFGAVGAYLLGKKIGGRWAGIAAAAVFVLAPYRALNLYVRGAVAELWALSTFPWLVWAGWEWLAGKNKASYYYVTALVALILSHNLSAFIFVPCLAVALLLLLLLENFNTNNRKYILNKITSLFGLNILGLGLTTWFWLPALAEKDYTQVNKLTAGYFAYHQHFIYIRQLVKPFWGYGGSAWGPDDGMSFFLGYAILAVLLLASAIVINLAWRSLFWQKTYLTANFSTWLEKKKRVIILLTLGWLLVVMAIFMSGGRSEYFWKQISPVQFIQFPWRWLGVAVLGATILSAVVVQQAGNFAKRIAVTAVIVFCAFSTAVYFQPEKFLQTADSHYYADAKRIQAQMSAILPDYIPLNMQLTQPPEQLIISAQSTIIEKVEVRNSYQTLLAISATQPDEIELAIADFPGWQVEIDGEHVNHATSDNGLILVAVPAGSHQVGAYFGRSTIKLTADIISSVALITTLFILSKRTLTTTEQKKFLI